MRMTHGADQQKTEIYHERLVLLRPSGKYADQVMAFKDELQKNGDSFDGCAGLEDCASFEEWVRFEERLRARYKEGYVPSEVFLGVRKRDDRLVGIIDYRHPLSGFLLRYGGNIGYSVRPSERRKGYASEMLRLMLDICRDYGEKRVLLTCDTDNTASRKTILKNGGVLENEIEDTVGLSSGGRIQRYWISTGFDDRGPLDMNRQLDILCIGMALVDSIIKGFDPHPVSEAGFRAASGSLNVGGEAVNEAMAAAKLGMKTGILCTLGLDGAGQMIEDALIRCGVDTRLILRSEDHPTPVTTMFVNDDGSRKSITNGSHRYNFHPERHTACLRETGAVILGSLFRAPFDDPEVILSVLRDAKAAEVLVFADTKLPNYRFLTLDDIADALPLIDYITPNEDEAKYYTGKSEPEDMADVFLARGVKNVIVKLGGRGCYYKGSGGSLFLPAWDIRAVDATGAGDNFIAALASELLRGGTIDEALRFASACGAICTTAVGASTALRSREQVLAFMREASLS